MPNAPVRSVGVEFRIGHVIGRTFRVLRRQAIAFSLLCIATSMPGRVLGFFLAMPTGLHRTIHVGSDDFDFFPWRFLMLPVFLCSLALMPLGSAIILVATMRALDGERPSLDAVFRQAASGYLPLLGCTVCGGLAVLGGSVLLLVPGVVVALVLSVSGQACVAERLGPIASLARSRALTKGYRWRIFGFYLTVAAIYVVISVAEGVALGGLGIAGTLVAYFLSGFAEAFRATACAVQYLDLRICREGVNTERIAAVFD